MNIHIINLEFQNQDFSIACFLIETADGPLLVETGPHSTINTLRSKIKKIGYNWKKIKHVLLTHIHLDHAGAAWCFAENGSNIYLHPLGYRHMHDPSRLLASATMIYGDNMNTLWGTLKPIPADLLHIVKDNELLNLNGLKIKAIHSPGHAKHHIAWQFDNVLFAGDVAGVRVSAGPVIPPCPPPDINIELWVQSIDKILEHGEIDTYYLTHFGEVTDCLRHMTELKETLTDYADFIYPFYQKKTPADDIVPLFTKFVVDYLRKKGSSNEEAASYESANPSYMSVRGLLRYWQKREAGTL